MSKIEIEKTADISMKGGHWRDALRILRMAEKAYFDGVTKGVKDGIEQDRRNSRIGVGRVKKKMGKCLWMDGRGGDGFNATKDAIKIFEEEQCLPLLRVAYEQAGEFLKKWEKPDGAISYFEKALAVCDRVLGVIDDVQDIEEDLDGGEGLKKLATREEWNRYRRGIVMKKLAECYFDKLEKRIGKRRERKDGWKKDEKVWELAECGRGFMGDAIIELRESNNQTMLMSALEELADSYRKTYEDENAVDLLEELIEVFKELPEEEKEGDAHRRVAIVLGKVGDSYLRIARRTKDRKTRGRLFEMGRDWMKLGIVELRKGDDKWGLASELCTYGEVLVDAKKMRTGARYVREGVEILREVHSTLEDNAKRLQNNREKSVVFGQAERARLRLVRESLRLAICLSHINRGEEGIKVLDGILPDVKQVRNNERRRKFLAGYHRMRSTCLLSDKRYEEAMGELEACLSVCEGREMGDVAGATYDLAICLMKLGDWKGGAERWQEYIGVTGEGIKAVMEREKGYRKKAECLLNCGDLDGAKLCIEKALKIGKNNFKRGYNPFYLAEIYFLASKIYRALQKKCENIKCEQEKSKGESEAAMSEFEKSEKRFKRFKSEFEKSLVTAFAIIEYGAGYKRMNGRQRYFDVFGALQDSLGDFEGDFRVPNFNERISRNGEALKKLILRAKDKGANSTVKTKGTGPKAGDKPAKKKRDYMELLLRAKGEKEPLAEADEAWKKLELQFRYVKLGFTWRLMQNRGREYCERHLKECGDVEEEVTDFLKEFGKKRKYLENPDTVMMELERIQRLALSYSSEGKIRLELANLQKDWEDLGEFGFVDTHEEGISGSS